MKNVTTVIINFQTPELLKNAVLSFKKVYPDARTIIFDNGSKDESAEAIRICIDNYPETVTAYFEKKNIYHGPAMHKALSVLVKSEFCFFLDSDTVTRKNGFLEKGVKMLSDDVKNYALGQVVHCNKRGFKDPDGIPVVLTPYLLMKTAPYKKFTPFRHHGQPVLFNFKQAQEENYSLIDFPMEEYIDHKWRGTATKYGYKLGLRGKIDYLLNKLGL